jgi:hypothetical protein
LFNYLPFLSLLLPIDGGVNTTRQKLYIKLGIDIDRPISHSPRIFKKSYVEDFCNIFYNDIKILRSEKFRSVNSFAFIDAFCFWCESNKNLDFLSNKRTLILLQSDPSWIIDIYNNYEINDRKKAFFLCIEDVRTEKYKNPIITDFLNTKFNRICKYENKW